MAMTYHRSGRFPWSFGRDAFEPPVITLSECKIWLTEAQAEELYAIGKGDIAYDAWVLRQFIVEMQDEVERLNALLAERNADG